MLLSWGRYSKLPGFQYGGYFVHVGSESVDQDFEPSLHIVDYSQLLFRALWISRLFSWTRKGQCGAIFPLWKRAYSNTLKCYHQKNWKFSDNFFLSFSYFCSKHRLWVLIRTASPRRFKRVPTIYVLSRNKKNNVYPCKPQFYYIKVGFKGLKII